MTKPTKHSELPSPLTQAVNTMRLSFPSSAPLKLKRLSRWAALAAFSALGFASSAQADEESSDIDTPWYQIEVIVFENRKSAQSDDEEVWPRDILLAYPSHHEYLLSPEELKEREALKALREAEYITPEGEQSALAPMETSTPAAAETARPEMSEPSIDSLNDALNEQGAVPSESPFVDLGEPIYQLKREKAAIDAERDMRVLYHSVWRQPVSTREQTPAVILSGGNQYDKHFELEGSLRISVSRYLHLDTDLWFTYFEANIGQEDGWWPPLPAPPLRAESFNMADDASALLDDSAIALSTTTAPWLQSDANSGGIQFGFDKPYSTIEEDDKAERLNNYVTKEIIKLEQSRRMRSGELHYIDHPKLGLLIRVDNYKTAAQQEAAESETDTELE